MRVLLSDGSGLTSRQVATQLAAAGHVVEALSPDPLALTRFTRHVRHVRRVPAYGTDPLAWLDAALAVFRADRIDVLFPTQEQVAVLAARRDEVRAAGVRTVVPCFDALVQVQDKVSAHATLRALGLPQPASVVLPAAADALAWDRFPVYLKTPIGTATSGVRFVRSRSDLASAVAAADAAGAFGDGGVLAQVPAVGQLVMLQSVFADGELVAFHANLRVREGSGGGSSHKRAVDLPDAREHIAALGSHLRWHGALSADAILTDGGPVYIDVNPRLVEPGNAWRAGVDLVSAMLDLALDRPPTVQPASRPGAATHQLLLAVMGAAQHVGTRRAVLAELRAAWRHDGEYASSAEELAPVRGDLRAAIPLAVATAALLARPSAWRWFSSGAVQNYALTPAGWRALRRTAS